MFSLVETARRRLRNPERRSRIGAITLISSMLSAGTAAEGREGRQRERVRLVKGQVRAGFKYREAIRVVVADEVRKFVEIRFPRRGAYPDAKLLHQSADLFWLGDVALPQINTLRPRPCTGAPPERSSHLA